MVGNLVHQHRQQLQQQTMHMTRMERDSFLVTDTLSIRGYELSTISQLSSGLSS
ncbi:hypothetical protein Mapa_013570 [Marchantia paleacea]|nr:hypothetical protein Mapa_013570 [Marchantia paleacea]